MNKRIWHNFVKDHWLGSLIYFLAIFLVILFYQLINETPVEVLYPVSIGIYAYLAGILLQGFSYFRFCRRLDKSIRNPQYDMKPLTALQREVNRVVNEIHNNYIRELHAVRMEQETKNRFLSQWIHKLKTPISVIDLTTQKEFTELPGAKEAILSIAEENGQLGTSIEQLLSLIRMDNFVKDYVPGKLELGEEVRQAINGMKNQFIIHHVYPELQTKEKETWVFSDRKWNRLMLEQFLSNAIKYSKKEGEQKHIFITLAPEEGGSCLTIRDEGIGIPEYDLYRIFEPFFTGDNGREVRNSTGIGLYIADMIAKKLNHRIDVKSAVGEGTSVIIHYSRNPYYLS